MMKLNADERNLILVQGLYNFGTALAGIFVSIYIFSRSNVSTTLLFNAVTFTALLLSYLCSGRVMETIKSGMLIRAGLFLNAVFYFLLFLVKDQAVHYLVPLGVLSGIGLGNFWAGLNLNQYVYSQHHTRVHYFGMQGVINNIFRAIGPVIGGMIIVFSAGYAVLFFIAFLVYFLAAFFIGKLPEHELLTFSYKKFITHKRSAVWKRVLWQHAIFGSFDVLMGSMTGILMFVVVKNELFLGYSQTISAIILAAGSWIALRLLKKSPYAFWVGAIGVAISIVVFAAIRDMRGLIFFVLLSGITGPFLTTWLLTAWFHTLDRQEFDWRSNFHVFIERDIALGIPRIVSYVILMYVLRQGDQVQLAWNALYVLPIFPILLGILFTVHAKRESEILPVS